MKAGYKKSEAGTIPSEWSIKKLGEISTFLDGKRRPVKDADRAKMRGIYPYYGASGIVDYVNDYIFDEPLILLGEDGENILSRSTRLAFKVRGKVWVNNHAHVIRPNQGTDLGFLVEYLESLNYEKLNSGTAQPKLNKQACLNIPVVCPPLPEQQAIANALSDADALIESLEQLIEKKRQIKQGVMQELLTGKRRLPGFSGEWEWGKLGELVQTIPGGVYGIEKKVAGLVGAKVATTAHISDEDEWNGKKMAERYFTSTQLEGYLVKTNDLVVVKSSGSAASIKSGKIGLVTEKEANKFVFSNFLMVLRPKNIFPNFLYSYLVSNNVKKLLPSLVEASTYPNIRRDEYLAIQIPVPKLQEQKEIAAFLAEQAVEIEVLAVKFAKLKQIKQAMMQELLTGKVRLV